MSAVGEGEPLPSRPGEVPDKFRAVSPRLFVLPLTGDEHRHVDLVHEGDGVERVGDRCVIVRVRRDLRVQVGGLAVEYLVGRARRIAILDLLVCPWLSAVGPGGLGLLLTLLCPGNRKAGIEDAARIERRRRGVEDRKRRDRLEGRRTELCREQLADSPVGDPHHPDLVIAHPWLACDRLDDVVSVEALKRLEEIEGATRAAGAAHVHVDDREAHQVREDGDTAVRAGRVGVSVTRIFDQGRVRRSVSRATWNRYARRQTGLSRGTCRRVHVDGELRSVAGGEVCVAIGRNRLVVDPWIPGRRLVGVHRQCPRFQPIRISAHAVTACRRHVPKQQPAERVGILRLEGLSRGVGERRRRVGCEAGDVHLVGAAERVKGRRRGGSVGGCQRTDDEPSAHQHRKRPRASPDSRSRLRHLVPPSRTSRYASVSVPNRVRAASCKVLSEAGARRDGPVGRRRSTQPFAHLIDVDARSISHRAPRARVRWSCTMY